VILGAAGHGHVGLAAALAAHLLATKLTSSPGLDLANGIGRHASGQLHLVAIHSGQHDGGGLELVLELVHGLAQVLASAPSGLRPAPSALDVHGLGQQLVALGWRPACP
jgi:hypothetical protein